MKRKKYCLLIALICVSFLLMFSAKTSTSYLMSSTPVLKNELTPADDPVSSGSSDATKLVVMGTVEFEEMVDDDTVYGITVTKKNFSSEGIRKLCKDMRKPQTE